MRREESEEHSGCTPTQQLDEAYRDGHADGLQGRPSTSTDFLTRYTRCTYMAGFSDGRTLRRRRAERIVESIRELDPCGAPDVIERIQWALIAEMDARPT